MGANLGRREWTLTCAAVGVAGAAGALARYYLGYGIAMAAGGHSYPGTLAVNLIGCFMLGWLTAWGMNRGLLPFWLMTAAGTGLIGSFTTFSTFSVESIQLLADRQWGTAAIYFLSSLWGGLAAAWAGYRLGNLRSNRRDREES
ncbi:fluoride efflux transporter CrcB [Paenibacillus sp. 32O-W]|uniref:fluoride efflux transporter CrcB n=1 Tax=Paenibacillus sp. 32O-W TaxID=1695218 RepID=UPI0011A08E94|nr:fluoride efflux transporter CrcB [Paenibacillus sp. 32O-W]